MIVFGNSIFKMINGSLIEEDKIKLTVSNPPNLKALLMVLMISLLFCKLNLFLKILLIKQISFNTILASILQILLMILFLMCNYIINLVFLEIFLKLKI